MIPAAGADSLGRDVQTDTGLFSGAASKHTPFFHTIHVIVAIWRATVRRAIVGFIPFLSKVVWYRTQERAQLCWPLPPRL